MAEVAVEPGRDREHPLAVGAEAEGDAQPREPDQEDSQRQEVDDRETENGGHAQTPAGWRRDGNFSHGGTTLTFRGLRDGNSTNSEFSTQRASGIRNSLHKDNGNPGKMQGRAALSSREKC